MPSSNPRVALALLAAFGALCIWAGVRLLTERVGAVDASRRLAPRARFTEWLGAGPDRPRRLLRAVGVMLVAAGLFILLRATRLLLAGGLHGPM